MNIGLNDSERSLIDVAKAFAEQHIEPFAAEWESNRRVPREIFVAAADAGLTGVLVPRELGGRGARFVSRGLLKAFGQGGGRLAQEN